MIVDTKIHFLTSFFVSELVGITNPDMFDFELAFDERDGDFDGKRRFQHHSTTHSNKSFLSRQNLVSGRSVLAFDGWLTGQLLILGYRFGNKKYFVSNEY